jgi:hypothetical protein
MTNARFLPNSGPANPKRRDHKMWPGRGWFWGVRSLYFLYFRRLNPRLAFHFLTNPPFISNIGAGRKTVCLAELY